MSDHKLIVLPGGATKNQLKEATRALQEGLPDMLEYERLTAQLHKAKFDALKEQGFTDEQALVLCKSVFS